MTDQPMTDEELKEILEAWEDDSVHRRTPAVPRLVAEVRRLRAAVDRLEDKLERAHYDILNAGEQ
jgi:hypothetical protein